jgi:hypothetical protein
MEQWMKALACASYDYMKLMVAELQRQLDEMEGERTSCVFCSNLYLLTHVITSGIDSCPSQDVSYQHGSNQVATVTKVQDFVNK